MRILLLIPAAFILVAVVILVLHFKRSATSRIETYNCSGSGGPANVTSTYAPGSCSWGTTNIPIVLPGGMTAQQCDTILKLVCISEHGNINWWNYYGDIADIQDGNGYTFGLSGFSTAADTESVWLVQDMIKISPGNPLAKYIPALKKIASTNSASHSGLSGFPEAIKSLAQSPDFRRASWDAVLHYFWNPAMAVVKQYGLKYPLSKGQVYDIVMNSGDTTIFRKVKAISPAKGGDESVWLANLQSIWRATLGPGGEYSFEGTGRADMWIGLFKAGNLQLTTPFTAHQDGSSYLVQ